jgi:hypothetical protein
MALAYLMFQLQNTAIPQNLAADTPTPDALATQFYTETAAAERTAIAVFTRRLFTTGICIKAGDILFYRNSQDSDDSCLLLETTYDVMAHAYENGLRGTVLIEGVVEGNET